MLTMDHYATMKSDLCKEFLSVLEKHSQYNVKEKSKIQNYIYGVI